MTDQTIFARLKEKLCFFARNNKLEEGQEEVEFIAGNQKQLLDTTPNQATLRKQYNILLLLFGSSLIVVLVLINIMQGKIKHKAIINDNPKPKVEVASEALDPEKMWRNHFEDLLNENKRKFAAALQGAEINFTAKEQKLQEELKLALVKMQAQLNFAKSELISATEELQRVRQIHEEGGRNIKDLANETNISAINLTNAIEFDRPKDAKIYIPETSYVSGYLLGGLAVSTAKFLIEK